MKTILFTKYIFSEGPPNAHNDSDRRDLILLCLFVAVIVIGMVFR
jgi:hypothetical protein